MAALGASAGASHADARTRRLRRFLTRDDEIDFVKLGEEFFGDFVPGSAENRRMIEIVDLAANKRVRRDLVADLQKQFQGLYLAFRWLSEIRGGRAAPRFQIRSDKCRKRLQDIVVHCVAYEIHPVAFLEYIDTRIDGLTGGDLRVPPLHVMAAPSVLDTAVCAGVPGKRPGFSKKPSASKCGPPPPRVDLPLFRRALTSAGFDTKNMIEEHVDEIHEEGWLLYRSIKINLRMIYPRSLWGDMVRWTADNWFEREAA